jgi:hypothetical protein
MSRQTAVEWLIENYWPLKRGLEIGIFDTLKVVEKAKEMEKEQIIDAHTKGYLIGGGNGDLYDCKTFKD